MKQSQSQSQSLPAVNYVFVYGSLRSDLPATVRHIRSYQQWSGAQQPVIRTAVTWGKLFWLRQFPGMLIPSEEFNFKPELVKGQLLEFKADQMVGVLRLLDQIEGYYESGHPSENLFSRKLVDCQVVDEAGEPYDTITAWVYTPNLIPIGSDYAAMKLD